MTSLFVYWLTLVLLLSPLTFAIDICSSQNTGDTGTLLVSLYQSNGLCSAHCQGFAYAILLSKQCWCSNYSPISTQEITSCYDSCPVCVSVFFGIKLLVTNIKGLYRDFQVIDVAVLQILIMHIFC